MHAAALTYCISFLAFILNRMFEIAGWRVLYPGHPLS